MSLNSYNRRLITAIYSRSEPSPSSFSTLAVLNDYALYKPLTHSHVHFVRSLQRIESDVIEPRFFFSGESSITISQCIYCRSEIANAGTGIRMWIELVGGRPRAKAKDAGTTRGWPSSPIY